MHWKVSHVKQMLGTPPFGVEEVTLTKDGRELTQRYYRIQAPSWVNIFALDEEGRAIMVRQPRVGMMQMTLEVPGGGIDADEDPRLAAQRELEEETGFRAKEIVPIGVISPNPAIMTNRLHMFLATGCHRPEQREHFPDVGEEIEIVQITQDKLDELLSQGLVHNALSSLTILMAQKFILKT